MRAPASRFRRFPYRQVLGLIARCGAAPSHRDYQRRAGKLERLMRPPVVNMVLRPRWHRCEGLPDSGVRRTIVKGVLQ